MHKIFNQKSINVSYCCMPNIGKIINNHNKKILEKKKEEVPPCNCRKKEDCPLAKSETSCRTKNVIYKASVKTEKDKRTYIGLTSMEFKKVSLHKTDFTNKKYKEATKLSNYI